MAFDLDDEELAGTRILNKIEGYVDKSKTEGKISKADEMFKKLGYKKYTSDDCIMYMKNLFMITFIIENRTFITEYKQGDYEFPKVRPFEITSEELQAINEKSKELRVD